MKIKRYFASDMRQAIRTIREEQGPDAVILSNRKIDGGIEILAAIEYDERLLEPPVSRAATEPPAPPDAAPPVATRAQPSDSSAPAAAPQPATSAAPRRTAPGPQTEWMQDPVIVEMRKEIKTLRGILENRLSHLAWTEMGRDANNHVGVFHRLTEMGIDADLARSLLSVLRPDEDLENAWQASLEALSQRLQSTDDDILTHGGVVALVGPTGVGKTTSVAKLAARFILRHGARHVALISTDHYRIGAHDQLFTYGQILGVPAYTADDAASLGKLLRDLADKRLILIDTAGMSQRDMRLSEQLGGLSCDVDDGAARRIRSYLVLSAHTQRAALRQVVRSFSRVPLSGALVTKLDEAASLGGLLSVLAQERLPVAYLSDGQRVPEDLQPARARALVDWAAALMTPAAAAGPGDEPALDRNILHAHA